MEYKSIHKDDLKDIIVYLKMIQTSDFSDRELNELIARLEDIRNK